MLKVAILDDYQNVSQEFVDLKKLSGKYEIKVFSEPFIDESDAIEQLSDFEALLIMRERTKITKNLISSLKKLKYIITSGMRNRAIDLDAAKKRKIPTATDTTTTIMLNRNVSSLVGQVTLLSSLKASPIKLKKPFLEDSRRVLGDITGLFLAIFETT